jgi:ABC-type lipoprotein release transport system permease subunit
LATGGLSRGFRPGLLLQLPYPLRNVLRRWRALIGMIVGAGLALGIGMTMLAVSKASSELLTADFRLSAADLYVVTRGGTVVPLLPGESTGTLRDAGHLLGQIRGSVGVRAAIGLVSWPLERQRPGPRRSDAPAELIATTGVEGEPTDVPGMLVLKQGRWLRRADEVVLGAKLSREKGLTLGDSLRLSNRDFLVVGIGRLRGLGLGADSQAYLDHRALVQRSGLGDVLNLIVVVTGRPEETRARIEEMASLSISDPSELIEQAEALNAAAVALRWIFNLLTLAIAGLFISTMLGRSVAERRPEFATLRAIGIPRRAVLLTIASEALLVSVVATILGLAVSLLLGYLIDTYLAEQFGIESLYAADAGLFLLVFGLALLLGGLAAWLPARRATRVDPAEVLREA